MRRCAWLNGATKELLRQFNVYDVCATLATWRCARRFEQGATCPHDREKRCPQNATSSRTNLIMCDVLSPLVNKTLATMLARQWASSVTPALTAALDRATFNNESNPDCDYVYRGPSDELGSRHHRCRHPKTATAERKPDACCRAPCAHKIELVDGSA